MTPYICLDVHDWSVADVFEWLTSAQLDEYSTSFRENEVNGSLLVDITLDDLDYLGVKKLGHRKIILRSIEDLRKNGRITHHLIAANEGDRESKVSGPNATSLNVDAIAAKKETVHWSHLEPLSLHQVFARI
jgi:SAM domain (Sterile alpha motif)